MIERIFVPGNEVALHGVDLSDPEAMKQARLSACLWRATALAIESAFTFGKDLPVGAVARRDDLILGRYFASDKRINHRPAHAEYMAVADALANQQTFSLKPDTVVVTLEPCDNCQDFLATVPSIKTVAFGLPRSAVSDRGLIKPHAETVFERARRVGLPYEVVQIDDPALVEAGGIILDHVRRNPQTELVEVDTAGLDSALVAFNSR